MSVSKVSHIAIGVRDMDRPLPFWTGVVGVHVTLRTIEEFKLGREVVRHRGVYLREREGPDDLFVFPDFAIDGAIPAGSDRTPPYESAP